MLRPVEVREGNKFIGVYPGSGYSILNTPLTFPRPSATSLPALIWPPKPMAQPLLRRARFGYKADEQKMRDMGLIRGAGPESIIILGETGPENGPLRFDDEYVRHKILDLIGDLALAGRRIEGHVVAERAGHAMHTALVSRLIKDRSAWELAHVPVAAEPAEENAEAGSPALVDA